MMFSEPVRNVLSNDAEKQLASTQYFVSLLSEENPPIQQVIDCGVVPYFLQFLRVDSKVALQVEAARAINAIIFYGTPDHVRYVVKVGAIPILIEALTSTNEDVRSLAAKALGSLTCDDAEYAQIILVSGALPALIQATQNSTNAKLISNVAFTMYNLFSNGPLPSVEVVRSALPFLNQLLYSQDSQTLLNVCETFDSISGGKADYIRAILALEKPILPQLIELLGNTSTKVIIAALKVIGQVLSDETVVMEEIWDSVMIQQNILTRLLWLLGHPDQKLHKLTCWVLSTLTASTKELQALIDATIFPKLLELLKSSDSVTLQPLEFHIRRFLVLLLARAVKCGTAEQVWYLIMEGFIPPLCVLLQQVDVMEGAQGTVGTDVSNEEQVQEKKKEKEIPEMDLLLVARRILTILDNMLSISKDNKKLEFIVNNICDSNDVMNTIEKWSYREFDDFGVLEAVTPHALNILKIVYHTKMISNDAEKQLETLQYFRKKISTSHYFLVQQVIESDVAPQFIEILQLSETSPALQEEAAFALVEISAGLSDKVPLVLVQTVAQSSSRRYRYLIDVGAVPVIIRLLSSSNKVLAANAATALGYIAKDRVENRDVVIECGVLPVLLKEMESSNEPSSVLTSFVWALGSLCGGNPSPNIEVVKLVLPTLFQLLSTQTQSLDALSPKLFLTHKNNFRPLAYVLGALQDLTINYTPLMLEINPNIISKLMELLLAVESSFALMQGDIIIIITNMITGDDSHHETMRMIVPLLLKLLDRKESKISLEACLSISKLATGTRDQIQGLIDGNIFVELFDQLQSPGIYIKKEAIDVICNVIPRSNFTQIRYFIDKGMIPLLCRILKEDKRLIPVILKTIEYLLQFSKENNRINKCLNILSDCGGLATIRRLQRSDSTAMLIMKNYVPKSTTKKETKATTEGKEKEEL